jgi:hypothetical protein
VASTYSGLMVQEVGHAKLRERGIDLIAADNPGSFIDDTPTAKLVRQVLGAISEFDKAMTVAKLRGARERKRLANVKAARAMPSAIPSWWRGPNVYIGRSRRGGPHVTAGDLGRAGSARFPESERPPLCSRIRQVDVGLSGVGRSRRRPLRRCLSAVRFERGVGDGDRLGCSGLGYLLWQGCEM